MEWQDQSWLQSHYIGDDGSNNNVGPNDGDGVHTNDSNCVGDDADTDGDNNNNINDGDKNYGGSNLKEVVVMMKEVIMLIFVLKLVAGMIVMRKMILILKMMLLKVNFMAQLDGNNLWSKTMCWVIGLYEPSCDLFLSSICWFYLYRTLLGSYWPLKFYSFT